MPWHSLLCTLSDSDHMLQGKVAAQAGDLTEARALFMEAIASEADCVEAIYNLGLVSKSLGNLEDALTAFKKLNSILTDDAAAMFQVVELPWFQLYVLPCQPLRSAK